MGSWECYCAICGGPFQAGSISRKPRTARFRRRHDANPEPYTQSEEDADDNQSLGTDEEECSYDPEILDQTDTEWMKTLHVLSLVDDDSSADLGFISGPGEYVDSGMVDVDLNPAFPFYHEFVCYDGAFPFHWCCFQLLCTVLGRNTDLDGAEMSKLFWAMVSSSDVCATRLENLNYGDPSPQNEQWWTADAGTEFFVAHPMESTGLNERLQDIMQGFQPHSPLDLSSRVRYDPFQKLSRQLLGIISSFLPVDAMMSWMTASWTVNVCLHDNGFWKRRIKITMPWAFEIHELLEIDQECTSDYKNLFLWLEKVTKPQRFPRDTSLPNLRLMNRRRIWHVCEQLADFYGRE